MAVGDFVTGLDVLTFQPLGTNVICITSAAWWDGFIQITNGVIVGYVTGQFNGTNNTYNTTGKIFIDNTNYLAFYGGAVAQESNYSGIQVV